jgi:hypothetical protein
MQAQEVRDQKTVDITIALGLAIVVGFTSAIQLWVVLYLVGLGDAASDVIGVTSLAAAGIAVIVYLSRVRGPRAGTTYP